MRYSILLGLHWRRVNTPDVCSPTCGNVISGAEQCDDGNTNNGDGCSSACQLESGFTCTGAVTSVCTPYLWRL
ncbi:MAG: DUF4215 domain-containing protein [Streptococcus sp.]|nr:DUF4215 domain-containing protein [Streptococcus sp.]